MRLNVRDRPRDPRCFHAKVYLDGVLVQAISADEEDGSVLAYRRGPDGKVLLHPLTRLPLEETLRGKVRIVIVEPDDTTTPAAPGITSPGATS